MRLFIFLQNEEKTEKLSRNHQKRPLSTIILPFNLDAEKNISPMLKFKKSKSETNLCSLNLYSEQSPNIPNSVNEGEYESKDGEAVPNSRKGSPAGSFRSFSQASIRGSQDSGYSDSGESNSSCLNTSLASPPIIKHVSRVYFGSESELCLNKLYENSPGGFATNDSNSFCLYSSVVRDSVSRTDASSPTSDCNSDEPQAVLENKSLLDISNTPSLNYKNDTIKKHCCTPTHRKSPRRCKSADKLSIRPRNSKHCKRRRSMIDYEENDSFDNKKYNSEREKVTRNIFSDSSHSSTNEKYSVQENVDLYSTLLNKGIR